MNTASHRQSHWREEGHCDRSPEAEIDIDSRVSTSIVMMVGEENDQASWSKKETQTDKKVIIKKPSTAGSKA